MNAIGVVILALLAQDAAMQRPKALLAMEQARQSVLSGRVEWTHCDHQRDPQRTFRYVSRYALSGDRILEERGDQDGWVTFEGRERTPHSRIPQIYLLNEAGTWHYQETDICVNLWKQGVPEQESNPAPGYEAFRDIRGLGVFPITSTVWHRGAAAIWMDAIEDKAPQPPESPVVRWSEQRVGDKVDVTGKLNDGTVIRWRIDPEKQWNAERIEITSPDGQHSIREECQLEKFSDTWFPRSVEIRVDNAIAETFTIHQASLNAPEELPARFSVKDIGVEPGMNVKPQNYRVERPHVLFWDGDAIVDFDAWKAAVTSGKREYGPTMKAKQADLGSSHSSLLTPEQRSERIRSNREMALRAQRNRTSSAWENYVKHAIERYGFDDDQRQKAVSILRECQGKGHEYLDRKREDFVSLQSSILAARSAQKADELKRLNERLEALSAPVGAIFEEQLKPRIESLPTRAQRKAAEQVASQPASVAP